MDRKNWSLMPTCTRWTAAARIRNHGFSPDWRMSSMRGLACRAGVIVVQRLEGKQHREKYTSIILHQRTITLQVSDDPPSLSLSQCDLEPSLLKVKDINNLQYKYVDTHKREIYLVLYYEQINEWMHNKSINKDIYICVCICKANGCSGSRVLSLCSQVYRQQIQPHNNQALFFGQFTFSIFVLLEKQVQTKPIMGQHLPEAKSTIVASNTRL